MTEPVDWKSLIDLPTASGLTGIPVSQLRERVRDGRLPAFKVAGDRKYLVRRPDLDNLLTRAN